MSRLSIKVEALPGSDVTEACLEAFELAERIGVRVRFDFNGVKAVARPVREGETNLLLARRLAAEIMAVMNGKNTLKFASV